LSISSNRKSGFDDFTFFMLWMTLPGSEPI
jgi:hypothetical protein